MTRRKSTRSVATDRRKRVRTTAALVGTAVVATATLKIRERRRRARAAAAAEDDRRERLTVQLPKGLIERARNAAFWTAGLTLTALVEDALIRAIERLERQRGEPFEQRTSDLRAGRPRHDETSAR